MRSPPVAGASACTVPAGAVALKPLPPPKIVPHSLFVLYAPYPVPSAAPAMPPRRAPLPAPLPPFTTAPPAAPRPAPSSAPMAPGFAMRMARSPPVLQSAAAVDATRVTGGRASERATAGYARGVDGDTVATYGVAGRTVGAGAACACASVVGRSIHAVVRPVLRAVTPVRAMPIVASFQWVLSMAIASVSG